MKMNTITRTDYHIMLIDDDPAFNFLNEEIIRYSRFTERVSTFISPSAALATLRESKENWPEIILLDINMPLMTGWEFLEAFEAMPEAAFNRCKIFMLSSSSNPADVEKSKTFKSVYNFYEKPLTAEILQEIKTVVEAG
jgi:CheY-like chemotaxis protein